MSKDIKLKHVDIYTDGACSGNPGPGGWAAIIMFVKSDGEIIEKELSGGVPDTTNNRMELTAVISAFEALREACAVTVYTDSKYIVDAVNLGWAKKWQKNNWVKPDKAPAMNPDLWEKLLLLLDLHEVELKWVRGHNGNPYNERCDKLAVAGARGCGEAGRGDAQTF